MENRPIFTFLFTDIEGSTKLWETQPQQMPIALQLHDSLLRSAIEQHSGSVFKTVGDAFCAVFNHPSAALQAAIAIQQALPRQAWGETPIRVRIGIHCGPADTRDQDYFGPTLNRTARLMSAGHGGQILLSQAAYDGLANAGAGLATLTDLGRHRLKDLTDPEQIYQANYAGAPESFAPLHTLNLYQHNLPVQVNALIGREAEVKQIRQLLQAQRLVTLTGPGGMGKTHLAMQVAAESLESFVDGVYWVTLAEIREWERVLAAALQILGIKESSEKSLEAALVEYLSGKQMLLVFDNFEQVVSAAPVIARLLGAASGVKVLITSRIPLHVRGEVEYPLGPLSLPSAEATDALAGNVLQQSSAAQLFLERARAVNPALALTPDNISAILAICRRLDGLPLALELAAARIKFLPPVALFKRLQQRLPMLTSGAVDLPERHQTLRATIAWSYELLDEMERRLFARLAVFAGSFSVDAVESINPDLYNTFELLCALADKSMLQAVKNDGAQGDVEARFRMLETIHEFAAECLQTSGEADELAARHFAFYVALAKEGYAAVNRSDFSNLIGRMNREKENLYCSLAWGLGPLQPDPDPALAHDIPGGTWLAGYLRYYWYGSATLREARQWLTQSLTLCQEAILPRAYALASAGTILWQMGEYAQAGQNLEEAIALARQFNDRWLLADSTHILGHLYMDQKQFAISRHSFEESLALFDALKDVQNAIILSSDLGFVAFHQNELALAQQYYEGALRKAEVTGSQETLSQIYPRLGEIARLTGKDALAQDYYLRALVVLEKVGFTLEVTSIKHKLGYLAQHQGDYEKAEEFFRQALQAQFKSGNQQGVAECLAGLAGLAAEREQFEQAARLFGAARGLLDTIGAPLSPADEAEWARDFARLEQHLDSGTIQKLMEVGRQMSLESVL